MVKLLMEAWTNMDTRGRRLRRTLKRSQAMRKIVGVSLVVVLALGVGSYALSHGSSARDHTVAGSGHMMGSGGMMGQGMMSGSKIGPGMMMGQNGMMGNSGMMGMGRSMMNGVATFLDRCRTMMDGWFGTADSPPIGGPYSHSQRDRGAHGSR